MAIYDGNVHYMSQSGSLYQFSLESNPSVSALPLTFMAGASANVLRVGSHGHWGTDGLSSWALPSDNVESSLDLKRQHLTIDGTGVTYVLGKGQSDIWKVGVWSSNATLWESQSSTLPNSSVDPGALEAWTALDVNWSSADIRRNHRRVDAGAVWEETTLGAPGTEVVKGAFHQFGLDLRIIQKGTSWFMASSWNGGMSWKETSIANLDSTSSLLAMEWRPDGRLDLLDGSGQWLRYEPMEFLDWSSLMLREGAVGLDIHWPAFPWATQYRVRLDGSLIESTLTELNTANLSALPSEGAAIEVQALVDGAWVSGPQANYQKGTPVSYDVFLPSSSFASSYQMLSVPGSAFVMDEKKVYQPLDYMKAFLGPEFHPANWRFGRYSPERLDYDMGTDISSMTPGSSYWIISAWNMEYKLEGVAPKSLQAAITLKPGWNMVGSPYGELTRLNTTEVIDGATKWTYSQLLNSSDPTILPSFWTWSAGDYVQSESIPVGAGAWVQNRRSYDVLLLLSSGSRQSKIQWAPLTVSQHRQKIRWSSSDVPPSPPSAIQNSSVGSSIGGSGGGCLLR
jgi:hypothetical protein